MQTNKIDLTDTYTPITTQAAFFFQNIGLSMIEVIFKDTAPAVGDKGFYLSPFEVITSGMPQGTAYARLVPGDSNTAVSVTE